MPVERHMIRPVQTQRQQVQVHAIWSQSRWNHWHHPQTIHLEKDGHLAFTSVRNSNKDLTAMVSRNVDTTVSTHKEEGPPRIRNDGIFRTKIQERLSACVHPLNPEDHPELLTNIAAGLIYPQTVHVDQALHVGKQLMGTFAEGLPQSFHKHLTKPIELMCSKIILRFYICRKRHTDKVLSYKLAAIQPSMFHEKNGEMRMSTSKSILKNKLPARTTSALDATVLDGCSLLWVVKWPAKGVVEDFLTSSRTSAIM